MSAAPGGERGDPREERLGVLHMINSLAPGGAERVCVDICAHLDPERFAPQVLTYRPGDSLAGLLRDGNVPWTYAPRWSCIDAAPLRAAVRLVRRDAIGVVHSHFYGASFWGRAVVLLRPGVKHIVHVHRTDFTPTSALGILSRLWTLRADAIITVADSIRRELIDRFGVPAARVVSIPNGVDTRRFTPADPGRRRSARATLGLPQEDFLIGIVARLRPEKDHETFLRAAASLASGDSGIGFVIAGDGEPGRTSSLTKLARDSSLGEKVHFLGSVKDVPLVLSALDVAVLSSRREGMPLALLEYMAAGLPLVSTRVDGIPEVLGAQPCALVTPVGDPPALAEALRSLRRDPTLCLRLGREARERAERHFSFATTMRRIEELYDAVAGRSV